MNKIIFVRQKYTYLVLSAKGRFMVQYSVKRSAEKAVYQLNHAEGLDDEKPFYIKQERVYR